MKRLRTALVLVPLGFGGLAGAGAQPDDGLPDDDGAPPEEYEPSPDSPEARTAQVLADELAPGAVSPPADNAFPIRGLSRSACSDSFGDPRSGGRTHMGVDCFAGRHPTRRRRGRLGPLRHARCGVRLRGRAKATSRGTGSASAVSPVTYYYGHLDTIAGHGRPAGREG